MRSGALQRARAALGRPGGRMALAGLSLAVLAVLLRGPAARLHEESSLGGLLFAAADESDRALLQRRHFAMYLPHSRSLHFFWLGNDCIAADYVWLKSIAYVRHEFNVDYKTKKFEWLAKLYNTVVELDPEWEAGCQLGASMLAAVGRETTPALDLLAKGMRARPDSWRLPYEAGGICLLAPGKAVEAARYYRAAQLRPGHPEYIDQVIPRLEMEAGRLEAGLRYARQNALAFREGAMGRAATNTLRELDAKLLQGLLERAVRAFAEREARLPRDLAELRRAGLTLEVDRAWAEEFVLHGDGHEALVAHVFGSRGREVPPELSGPGAALRRSELLASLVAEGVVTAGVRSGAVPAPEASDAYGRPFVIHPEEGAVRSLRYSLIRTRQLVSILRTASVNFRMKEGRFARSLDEIAAYFAARIRAGKAIRSEWVEIFRDGAPPEHPMAPWGHGFDYDGETGRVDSTWEGLEDDLDASGG